MQINNLYLELLKRAVNNYLYLGGNRDFDHYDIADFYSFEKQKWHIPNAVQPHSLLSMRKLNLLQLLMSDVVMNNIPGDFIEAGVFKGGTVIFMLGFLKSSGINDRLVWAADSYAGIPEAKRYTHIDDPVRSWENRWSSSLETVKANINRYGLSDSSIRYIEGNFESALPKAHLGKIALARLDADAYESTRDALEHIYPRLSQGSYVIIDDWHLATCRQACVDFRNEHNINEPIASLYGANTENIGIEAFWRVEENPLASY